MPKIEIGPTLEHKIESELNFFAPKVPYLSYYSRSYRKNPQGQIIELGDGFILSYRHDEEIQEIILRESSSKYTYVVVDLKCGSRCVVAPHEEMAKFDIIIDYAGGRIVFSIRPKPEIVA